MSSRNLAGRLITHGSRFVASQRNAAKKQTLATARIPVYDLAERA
jgi:hypothetical protein